MGWGPPGGGHWPTQLEGKKYEKGKQGENVETIKLKEMLR
jgi:hypothetical protein